MNNSTKIFKATLTEIPDEVPRCGDIKVAVAYQFSVDDRKGEPKKEKLIAIIVCPEFLGDDFFKVGNKYYIKARHTSKDSSTASVFNSYPKEKNIWWVDEIRKK